MKSTFLLLAFAALTASAHADNISVRVSYGDGRSGITFTPVHAEVGQFAVTPALPATTHGGQWRVVAKNVQGKILHEVLVSNEQLRQVEIFDPKTGAIELAQQVRQPSGVFEVSLPYTQGLASVEVLPHGGNGRAMAGAEAPLARFDRNALDTLAASSRKTRIRAAASSLAAPTTTTILETGASNAHGLCVRR